MIKRLLRKASILPYRKTSWYRSYSHKDAEKYTWTKTPQVKYKGGITLNMVNEGVFALAGLTKAQAENNREKLKRSLIREAPSDTGRLKRSYTVTVIEGKYSWILGIINDVWYFRFPYHYYRGEIRWNHRFIRDFIQDAVDPIARAITR